MKIELSVDEYKQAIPLLFNSNGYYLDDRIHVMGAPSYVIYFERTDDAFTFAELLGIEKSRIKVY